MKKVFAILLTTLACSVLFSGCGAKPAEEQVAVYSFSGDNEVFSISNGVIVLAPTEEVFYGGNLEGELPGVVSYSMTFYISSGNDDKTLLSNKVSDMTGGTISISGETGKVSGDILKEAELDELQSNLYFELKTTNLEGEENTYSLQLTVTEVTRTRGK